MMGAIRGELFASRRRPAMWIISVLWIVLALLFAVIIPLIVYHAIEGSADYTAAQREEVIAGAYPQGIVSSAAALYPLFGSAMMLILGTIMMGGEYRWATLGTLLTQGPSRVATVLAKWVSGALTSLMVVVALFGAFAVAGLILALAEGHAVSWPDWTTLLGGVGAAWLVSLAALSVGMFLVALFRSSGTAIGVGLIWLLALENVVAQLATLSPALNWLPRMLLSPNAGSLAAALGSASQRDGGVPGVVATSPPWLAVAVLIGYAVVFAGLAAAVVRRRDVP
jgi:ABC-2 type transport system permease protein